MEKKSKKVQGEPSGATSAANSHDSDKRRKPGYGRRRRPARSCGDRPISTTDRGLEQAGAQVSENNGSADSIGLQELNRLVQQLEMLKNKMRDLFMRAQEMNRHE